MAERQFKTPETTVFRKIGDELVVIQLDTAHYYYFNPETEGILNYFKTPQSLDSFIEVAKVEPKEAEYVKDFCRFLLEKNILAEMSGKDSAPQKDVNYEKPKFLREGEKTLDQISFTSP